MIPDSLRPTLQSLLQADALRNPAFDRLLLDYSNYHRVFMLLGTPIAILMGIAAFLAWRNVARMGARGMRRTAWRMTAFLGVVSTVTGLFLGLVLVANASNVLSPRSGFSALAATLPPAPPGSELARLHHGFDLWLSSGSAAPPAPVTRHVQERLAWQRPKALLCGLLLAVLTALTVKFWSRAVKPQGGAGGAFPDAKTNLLLILSVPGLHLLALMFIANTQAALAPITITMLFG